ncbi:glycosyltransferase [Arthrobacter zhangbolii]|uniref:Glycosyltransferase n=1 Tax=Arthrobacter zhangbolii TaxID=2886936 RepID=A0A9X1S9K7_9MICC|nr:glycosyltransferase family 2 protein [Arthrobacter zhangbolii]MCC3273760.1 glycosyltransferase [Arthrobacter zhangbolii]UON91238.1 glycosyltransferase [Arthrobacter zhangbolii]
MEKIDVLLPYYGDVEFMKIATASVLAQSYDHWRLLVLDDAYADDEPARWFAGQTDPRITYLRNSENLGASGNFRKALSMAQAPLTVMMGADDVMLPGYLQRVAEILDAYPQVAVAQPRVQVIDEYGYPILPLTDRIKRFISPKPAPEVVIGGEDMAASLLHGGWHYFPSLAWRTAEMQRYGFRPGYDVVQDLALLLDIAAGGGSMVLFDDTVFQYRRHSRSDSSVRAGDGRRFEEERRFFCAEAERFRTLGWQRAARAAHLHWTSRLHALSLLLRTARSADWGAAGLLWRHVVR